jgi:voltage-gated sodium channel
MKKRNSSSRLPELGQSSFSSSARKDRNRIIDLAQGFVGSKMFDWIITGVIILQAIALAVEATPFINSAGQYYHLIEVGTFSLIQSLVIAVFIVEAMLRMIALYPRPQNYFRDPWNCFDFAIIVSSLTTAGQFSTIARLVRLLRITRLVTKSAELRAIVSTLVRSIPSIFNILNRL